MQKIVLSAWLLATLVACGKGGAEQYVGIWQDRKIGASEFGEIRKEGDQYLFEDSSNGKKWALYEKDGAWFTRNSYNPDEQLKLSSDGNTLFFDTTPVFRVKAGVCQELAKEYLSKKPAIYVVK